MRLRHLSLALLPLLFGCAALKVENPVTGERQFLAGLSPKDEVELGRKAVPDVLKQYGGEDPDARLRGLVDATGRRTVAQSAAARSGYPFEFHLLGDRKTLNAFALPGGQVFITRALLDRLSTEAQLAGVLGHEVGHVVARHGSEQMAQQMMLGLGVGLVAGAAADASDAEKTKQREQWIAFVAGLASLRYSREDELEADALGVRFLAEASLDPRAMLEVMEVLRTASSGGRPPEFLSTHPNPENREARINDRIRERFPKGVPASFGKGAVLRK